MINTKRPIAMLVINVLSILTILPSAMYGSIPLTLLFYLLCLTCLVVMAFGLTTGTSAHLLRKDVAIYQKTSNLIAEATIITNGMYIFTAYQVVRSDIGWAYFTVLGFTLLVTTCTYGLRYISLGSPSLALMLQRLTWCFAGCCGLIATWSLFDVTNAVAT